MSNYGWHVVKVLGLVAGAVGCFLLGQPAPGAAVLAAAVTVAYRGNGSKKADKEENTDE